MQHLKDDKAVYEAIQEELNRQRNKLEMIASENIVSYAVMEAQGSVLTNKYAEGYPEVFYTSCQMSFHFRTVPTKPRLHLLCSYIIQPCYFYLCAKLR